MEIEWRNFKIPCLSIYKRPSTDNLDQILDHVSDPSVNLKQAVICMDSKAQNRLWGSQNNDRDRRTLEDFVVTKRLNIINPPLSGLAFRPSGTTFVDVTIMGDTVASKTTTWMFLDQEDATSEGLDCQGSQISTQKEQNKI